MLPILSERVFDLSKIFRIVERAARGPAMSKHLIDISNSLCNIIDSHWTMVDIPVM